MDGTWVIVEVNEMATNGETEWKDLCRGVAHRHGLSIDERGVFRVPDRNPGGFSGQTAGSISQEKAQELGEKVGRECDEIIKAARIAKAIRTLEGVEQVRDSLTATGRAIDAFQTGLATAKTGAEYAEVAQRWGPAIVTAWAWIGPHLQHLGR